jgi:hypothetical protein
VLIRPGFQGEEASGGEMARRPAKDCPNVADSILAGYEG